MKNLFYTLATCTLALSLNACNGGGSSGSSDGGGLTPPANTSNFMMVGSAGKISQLTGDNNAYQPVAFPASQISNMTISPQGKIVAITVDSGYVINSTDGKNWNYQSLIAAESTIQHSNFSIAVNNAGLYIAISPDSSNFYTVFTSSDGINWTQQPSPVSQPQAIASHDNQIIIAGAASQIATTTDGKNFVMISNASSTANGILTTGMSVDKTGNLVAAGLNGIMILLKNDPIWKGALYNLKFNAVTVNDSGKFIAVGSDGTIATSNDAVNWTPVTSPTTEYLTSVTADNNGGFIAVGANGTIITSTDGDNWVKIDSGTSDFLTNVIVTPQGKFIITGQDGVSVGWLNFSGPNDIFTSSDGVHWTKTMTGSKSILYAITFSPKHKFVAVGENTTILQSNDGKNWINESSGIICQNIYCYLFGITANNRGKLVAVGFSIQPNGTIINSNDGKNWQSATNTSINSSVWLYGITSNDNGRFFTVGSRGVILTSADGDNWSSIDSGTTNLLTAIALSSQGRFVVVGQSGTILTSPNGYNWTAITPFTSGTLWSVACNSSGRFVAVGDKGTIFTSIDGSNWTPVSSGTTATLIGVSVNSAGKFVAVGGDNMIITSTDGINWSIAPNVIPDYYGFSAVTAY